MSLKERQMLRRVGVLGVDGTRAFTVIALGEALASLVTLRIECRQLDGSWRTFDVLAGEAPMCVPGAGNIRFHIDYVQVKNVGQVPGVIYVVIIDDQDVEILAKVQFVEVGGIIGCGETVRDMPMRDYALTVEVGH